MASRIGAFIACAFALGVATASAHADTAMQGTASISNFSYQLIDLTPDDGQTPWIQLASPSPISYAILYDAPQFTSPAQSDTQIGAAEQTISLTGSSGSAQASWHDGAATSNLAIQANSAFAESWSDRTQFTLSPNTLVVFYADGSADLSFDPASAQMVATAQLAAQVPTGTDGNLVSASSLIGLWDPGQAALPLTLAMRSGADGLAGTIEYDTSVQATAISPVPEPAEAAMLLAGLALLPAWRRRARRKAMRHD